MKVSTSPEFLEIVANHPRVFKSITCKGISYADLTSNWKNCIGLEFDTGGFLFHKHDPETYEVHTLFLPKSKNVDLYAKQAIEFMFTKTDAAILLTQVAQDLPHVRRFTLRHGFVKFGEGIWHRPDKDVVSDYYELSKERWRTITCQQ